jgi:hypothetical protein
MGSCGSRRLADLRPSGGNVSVKNALERRKLTTSFEFLSSKSTARAAVVAHDDKADADPCNKLPAVPW